MIVQNEEQRIGRCLESVSSIAGEIIVVDTGSSDATKEICLNHGAKVYDFPRTGDFSEARNFGLTKASGGFLLWLNADEELETVSLEVLRAQLEVSKSLLFRVRMLHFYGPEPAAMERAYLSSSCRLFRSGAGIRFGGRIHEHLCFPEGGGPPESECLECLRILHYGYMDIPAGEKATRNTRMLLEEKEPPAQNPWTDYHLAAEYYRSGDCSRAFHRVNDSIAGFLKQGRMPPPLTYKLKYDLLVTTRSFASVLPGIDKAIALYPDYVDLHFYKAIAQMSFEQYEKAAETFTYCLILGESNPDYLILAGTGSFFALYYLGLCYEKQEKREQADECFRQTVTLRPGFSPAADKLARPDIPDVPPFPLISYQAVF